MEDVDRRHHPDAAGFKIHCGALMSGWGAPASARKRSTESRDIVRGLDTHKDLHIAAVVDDQDRIMGTQSFATPAGAQCKCSPGCAPSGLAMRLSEVDRQLRRGPVMLYAPLAR
jgi:hypothetical protein